MAIEALDRRHEEFQRDSALKRSINQDQFLTLRVLEGFGWTLKFVFDFAAQCRERGIGAQGVE